MQWLPALEFQGQEVLLPLSAGTALALLRLAHPASNASTSNDQVAEILADAVLVDPLVCLWFFRSSRLPTEPSSIQSLVAGVESRTLWQDLAQASARHTLPPESAVHLRARRAAVSAAWEIARTAQCWAQAVRSPQVLEILLSHAMQFVQATWSSSASRTAALHVGPADLTADEAIFAQLEHHSSFTRRLARRVRSAWRNHPFDPRDLLSTTVSNMGRLSKLENQFHDAVTDAKLSALKELAYGASHEINNPLANIVARAQLLLRKELAPDRQRALRIIYDQAMRAHEMIADLMLFAQPPPLNPERLRVSELMDEVIHKASEDAAHMGGGLRVVSRFNGSLGWIDADRVQIRAALDAICRNALEAMGEDGTLAVLAAPNGRVPGRKELRLRFRDTGPGIPDGVFPHIFDPFYSGREAGRGLGFGLSKAWRIIVNHGGALQVDPRMGTALRFSGARFTVRLPGYICRQVA